MQPEPSLKIDVKAILSAALLLAVFWTAAVVFLLVFQFPGVITLTPLAWGLAFMAGRIAVKKSTSQGSGVKLIEAALAGALLGLLQGLLYALVTAYFLPAAQQNSAAVTVAGVVVCALLALLMGWRDSRAPRAAGVRAVSRPCPTCGREMLIDKRYPEAICPECMQKASDENGRRLSFFNETISGGLKGFYAGTNEVYKGMYCYVDGIKCRAREARMGGVIIEKM